MSSLDVTGLDSLIAKLNRIGAKLTPCIEQAVKQVSAKAMDDARNNAPASGASQGDSSGSGSLKNSFSYRTETDGQEITGTVETNCPHAAYVEFGTGSAAGSGFGTSPNVNVQHTTRASWVYPVTVGGELTFYTTSGQPARPFLYPAAKDNQNAFKHAMESALKKAIGKA